MQRIQKISAILVYIITFLLIAIALFHGTLWCDYSWVEKLLVNMGGGLPVTITTPEGIVNLAEVKWTLLSKTVNILSDIVGCSPFYCGLLLLRKVFKAYEKGEIFSVKTVEYYRYLGYLFFVDAVAAKPLSNLLEILSVTLSNPPEHRYISLNFGTPNIEQLFWGSIVIVISWIMLEASKLYEDQQLTV